MTHMFPEIVEGVRKEVRAKDAIFEGEALAFNDASGEYYPFQFTIQRKRKHGVEAMADEFPLHLFAFDVLYADGVDYTPHTYAQRREKLRALIGKAGKGDTISVADSIITDDPKKLEKFFEESVERGLEGIIAKDLNAPYVAGARKFAWIKLKRSYKGELEDTVDLVIVGYYLGKGKRAKFGFGGLLGAVYDEDEDVFKTVTKLGSGFSEEQMTGLEKMLDKIKLQKRPARVDSLLEPDFWVDIKYVITVAADEITRSPLHMCGRKKTDETGYALRFPRMVGEIRSDKKPEDATTVNEIIEMFGAQKKLAIEEGAI